MQNQISLASWKLGIVLEKGLLMWRRVELGKDSYYSGSDTNGLSGEDFTQKLLKQFTAALIL